MLEGATLVVFADDWGRHPSSAQHLLRRFLGQNRVIWVNTVGLRLPRPTGHDLRKLARKLRHWGGRRPSAAARRQPELHELPLLPLALGKPARWLNARLLRRAVRGWIGADAPAYLITTLPLTADLVGAMPHTTFVYYLVDDYASWPGLGGPLVQQLDEEQASGADLIVAASQALAQMHAGRARGRMVYLPHGVDVEHFGTARAARVDRRFRGETPLADVVFFGALDERIDGELLSAVAAARPKLRFLLVGPATTSRAAWTQAGNVVRRDAVSYDELPTLLSQCTVALLPYVRGPLGERLSPLKAREALAAGLPVVASDVPELRTLPVGVYLGRSAAELADALDHALENTAAVPTLAELAVDSWEARAERFSELLDTARTARGRP